MNEQIPRFKINEKVRLRNDKRDWYWSIDLDVISNKTLTVESFQNHTPVNVGYLYILSKNVI